MLCVAMHSETRQSNYGAQGKHTPPPGKISHAYLIVQRPNIDTLTISIAGRAPALSPPNAPQILRARRTMVATLTADDPLDGAEMFSLNLIKPSNIHLTFGEGFAPAEGLVIYKNSDKGPVILASGRGADPGFTSPPKPLLVGSTVDRSWHCKATHIPWVAEHLVAV